MDDQLAHAWLTLVRVPGLCARLDELLTHFGGPQELCGAKTAQLSSAGLSDATIRAIGQPDEAAIVRDLAWLQRDTRHLISRSDSRYPRLLAQIDSPPVALFVAGNPDVLSLPQLAIVGSRNPTPSGSETAAAFANHLASFGLAITSGMANGIDGAAHRGALQAAGATIAVCGTGLDTIYPPQHRELAGQIAKTGALVSEFATGVVPAKRNFPRRNRIISGMAVGTLVVEAAKRSGSLITAHLATSQGREVFAIPGSIHNPMARGCHKLIREGAKLVESADDILDELAALLGLHGERDQTAEVASQSVQEDDHEYQLLLNSLAHDPATIDTLVDRSGLTPDAVSSMLLILELQGRVLAIPGGRFVCAPEGG